MLARLNDIIKIESEDSGLVIAENRCKQINVS